MEKKKLIMYFKCAISDKKMSNVLYAIFFTQSKLLSSHNHSIRSYNRKQNSTNLVDVVIEIDSDRVIEFEELADLKLKNSEQFQGKLNINN